MQTNVKYIDGQQRAFYEFKAEHAKGGRAASSGDRSSSAGRFSTGLSGSRPRGTPRLLNTRERFSPTAATAIPITITTRSTSGIASASR